jgi:peptidoglycan hydrolase CwlO-like protein
MRKLVSFLFIISCFFLLLLKNVGKTYSVDCKIGASCNSESECEELKNSCQQELSRLQTTKSTLASEIKYMDTQIYLTELKVQETEQKITQTQKEIDTLGSRIEGLDSSLNYLSKLLLEKIVESYKQRSLSLFDYILNAGSAGEFLAKVKYLKTTQNNNQKIVVQVQQAKLNFEEQKTLREEKIQQLDNLKNTLVAQKHELDIQKEAKQKLLADTQNSENVYQELLARAQRQLSAFKSFVQTSGAGSIIGANGFGTGSDGSYYSQRDERWAYKTIGYSSENILNVGCLITSIAMFGKKFGSNITPLDIASDISRFWGNTAWMKLPWPGVAGKEYVSVDIGNIANELDQGNPVIVGVQINNCYSGGNHYVLLIKKEGNDYIMHDPIYGPDIKFSSHYSTICSAATFK